NFFSSQKVQCINEQEDFLAGLISEIGLALKSTARCTGIRLIKLGPFTIEHALVQKHWTLENLIENIYYCNQLMRKYRVLDPDHESTDNGDVNGFTTGGAVPKV